MISQDYLYELLQRSDMAEVAAGYMQLRQRGRTYTGLCPFHNEKSPSLHIYPDTQSFYCFGCGAGGDVITFIRRIANLDYVEAVRLLAGRVGMPMPEETNHESNQRKRILDAQRDAARFFFQCLNSEQGVQARRYWMQQRGLSGTMIKRFGLGYALNSFQETRKHLRGLGYTDEELLAAGLIKRSEKGTLYDVFRNRVMVPIFDVRGNVIAFGGRNLGDEKPKYINTAETQVYKKGRTVFAMNLAKKSVNRRYILCEGYLDVIALHQAGFDTAVAGCGTALTPEQVKLLSEYAQEVVLCYDTDQAGQKATRRAVELFADTMVKVSVLHLPDAKDPDEFLRKNSPERFEELLNGTKNALEHELMELKSQYRLDDDGQRVQYVQAAAAVLAGDLTPVQRDVYAGRIEAETGVQKSAVLAEVSAQVRKRTSRRKKEQAQQLLHGGVAADIRLPFGSQDTQAAGRLFAEQQLLAAALRTPQNLTGLARTLQPENFLDQELAGVYELIKQRLDRAEPVELGTLGAMLSQELVQKLARLLARNDDAPLSADDIQRFAARIAEQAQLKQGEERTTQELAEYMQSLKNKKLRAAQQRKGS